MAAQLGSLAPYVNSAYPNGNVRLEIFLQGDREIGRARPRPRTHFLIWRTKSKNHFPRGEPDGCVPRPRCQPAPWSPARRRQRAPPQNLPISRSPC